MTKEKLNRIVSGKITEVQSKKIWLRNSILISHMGKNSKHAIKNNRQNKWVKNKQ